MLAAVLLYHRKVLTLARAARWAGMSRLVAYFEALRDRDANRLKEAILSFEKQQFKSAMKRLYEHTFSHHTLGLAKLAWYKGFPIEIDSPNVPQAMLPISPLPAYDDKYHFLSGGQGIAEEV